jgi:hypothetical protein
MSPRFDLLATSDITYLSVKRFPHTPQEQDVEHLEDVESEATLALLRFT